MFFIIYNTATLIFMTSSSLGKITFFYKVIIAKYCTTARQGKQEANVWTLTSWDRDDSTLNIQGPNGLVKLISDLLYFKQIAWY